MRNGRFILSCAGASPINEYTLQEWNTQVDLSVWPQDRKDLRTCSDSSPSTMGVFNQSRHILSIYWHGHVRVTSTMTLLADQWQILGFFSGVTGPNRSCILRNYRPQDSFVYGPKVASYPCWTSWSSMATSSHLVSKQAMALTADCWSIFDVPSVVHPRKAATKPLPSKSPASPKLRALQASPKSHVRHHKTAHHAAAEAHDTWRWRVGRIVKRYGFCWINHMQHILGTTLFRVSEIFWLVCGLVLAVLCCDPKSHNSQLHGGAW